MNDIRADLVKRLKAIKREHEIIEARHKELEAEEKTVTKMLQIENKHYGPHNLTVFVLEVLQEAKSSLSVKDIKGIATSKDFIILGPRPGQRIQGALLALKKTNEAIPLGKGYWCTNPPPQEN